MNTEDSHGDTLRWTIVSVFVHNCPMSIFAGLGNAKIRGKDSVPVQMKRADCGADAEDRRTHCAY